MAPLSCSCCLIFGALNKSHVGCTTSEVLYSLRRSGWHCWPSLHAGNQCCLFTALPNLSELLAIACCIVLYWILHKLQACHACLQVITQQQGIITTLTLSLVWIVYSIIPQYLLLHYTWVGRGTTLRYACQIGFWVSSLCAFCAILLLWLVYPKTVSGSIHLFC